MEFKLNVELKKVDNIEDATHILALNDYGTIKRGDIVEVSDLSGCLYVYDMDADEENEILNEIEQNFLYEATCVAS